MILEEVVRLLAGCVLVALAAAVLLRRRRDLSAVAFGVFALGLGALYVFRAIGASRGPGDALAIAVNLVIMAGFWTMFLVFPTRLAREERHLLGLAFAMGFLGNAAAHVPLLLAVRATGDAGALALAGFWFVASAGVLAGVVLFPLRARRLAPTETSAARSLAIFSVGCALFRGFDAAAIPAAARGLTPLATLVGPALVLALPAALWVAVAARGAHARLARNTVLAHAGVVVGALALSSYGASTAVLGLAGALLLGFAVLRGQIAGLDLKVRFAVSKSTVAAVFVAVFFVASEAAQTFLGDTLGGQYVGIAAAGALVFAIAPLQRVAERLAERAVPVAATARDAPMAHGRDAEARDTYRVLLACVLREHIADRREERALAYAATALGLSAREALELRHEVEDARVREVERDA